MKRGRLPLLWSECLNLCGVGSKYNLLRSHWESQWPCQEVRKKMSSVLNTETRHLEALCSLFCAMVESRNNGRVT